MTRSEQESGVRGMNMRELVERNRSYRRFHQDVAVDRETLRELVDLARLSASALNAQPLKYILSCEPERNALIFPHLGLALALKDWPGPADGERPAAYIVILGDTRVLKGFGCDYGIAAQSMLLGATEKGLGGCMIASVNKNGLRSALDIPDEYEIILVVALGKPEEKVVIERVGPDGKTAYWRDSEDVHHVPKRSLDDIIIG